MVTRGIPEQRPTWAISEKNFQRQVTELATLYGYARFHPWLSVRSTPGFPDLVLLRPPRRPIYAELKSETGRLTASQQEWLDLLRACDGTEVYVWRPSDLSAIAEILRRAR